MLGIVSPRLETLAIPRIAHLFRGSDQGLGGAAFYAIQLNHYPAVLLRLPPAKERGGFCHFPPFNKQSTKRALLIIIARPPKV